MKLSNGDEVPDDSKVVIVCGDKSHFADDVHTTCDWCKDAKIVHRPHMPEPSEKVCHLCAFSSQLLVNEAEHRITDETYEELLQRFPQLREKPKEEVLINIMQLIKEKALKNKPH